MEVQNSSLYNIPHFSAIIKGFLNIFRVFSDICEALGDCIHKGFGFLYKMTRGRRGKEREGENVTVQPPFKFGFVELFAFGVFPLSGRGSKGDAVPLG